MDVWIGAAAAGAAAVVLSRMLGGRRVPAGTVAERIRAGAQIVDVRTEREFRRGAYPGAMNIPLGMLAMRANDLERSKSIILYCRSGARSAAGARILKRAGFVDVVNAGGLHHMPR